METASCNAELTELDHCGSDGLIADSSTCAAGCVAGTADGDHCGHIQPAWLPDVCDDTATMPTVELGVTLDVQDDSACTGGVLEVNGTTFCVVRAATIEIGDLKVTGTRAIAFVADDNLEVTGVLDVSADGSTPGPGAGTRGAGSATLSSSYKGGGGAGFVQTGGAGGGNNTGTEAGMTGGAITDRLTTDQFVGGATTTAGKCGTTTVGCINAIVPRQLTERGAQPPLLVREQAGRFALDNALTRRPNQRRQLHRNAWRKT